MNNLKETDRKDLILTRKGEARNFEGKQEKIAKRNFLERYKKMYSFPQRSIDTWNVLKEEVIMAKNVLKEEVIMAKNVLKEEVIMAKNVLKEEVIMAKNVLKEEVIMAKNVHQLKEKLNIYRYGDMTTQV